MRIAIIILGIIGLLFLALKWDTLSSDTQAVPREGSVLHSNDKHSESVMNDKASLCPKCKQGNEFVLASDSNSIRTCKIHGAIPLSL